VHLRGITISSNTNTNALLRGGATSTRTKTETELGQSISAKRQRFAVKSVTKLSQTLKVSLLAYSRSSIGGYVEHRSGFRKTRLRRLPSHSCSGHSAQVFSNGKFSGTVSSSVSKASPHTQAHDA
jgi:hypothetical protein